MIGERLNTLARKAQELILEVEYAGAFHQWHRDCKTALSLLPVHLSSVFIEQFESLQFCLPLESAEFLAAAYTRIACFPKTHHSAETPSEQSMSLERAALQDAVLSSLPAAKQAVLLRIIKTGAPPISPVDLQRDSYVSALNSAAAVLREAAFASDQMA